jgi:hypothetical protein
LWLNSRGSRLVLLHDRNVTALFQRGNTAGRRGRKSVENSSPNITRAGLPRIDSLEQKKNIVCSAPPLDTAMPSHPSSSSKPHPEGTDELELAVEQAIAACGGDLRGAIRALILANDFLENEVSELMKAVSHAYVRGRFQSYSG